MKVKLLLLGCGLAMSATTLAKKSPDHNTELLAKPVSGSVKVGNKSLNSRTGLPSAIFNINQKVSTGSIEEKARQYLSQNPSLFKNNKADHTDLRVSFVSKGKASTTVRFKQFVGDVPVYKSDIAVSINNKDLVTTVSADYKIVDRLISAKSSLSSFLAEDIALNFMNFKSDLKELKSELVVYAEEDIPRLAYKVNLASESHPGEWELLIDAQNGTTLQSFDKLAYIHKRGVPSLVNGTVTAFNPGPLVTAGATYGDTGYVDGNDANTPQLQAEVYAFNALIQEDSGTYKLQNTWAEIVDLENPSDGLFTQNSNDFTYHRGDNEFEASNVFYHIQHYMAYLNTTLSVPVMPYQYVGGVRFDPHGLNGADNSYYSTGTGAVVFGEGGVDDSEDADVIIHELGHGLHDWLTGGGLSQVNGLSEGLGDYYANSYARTRPDNQWTPSDDEYYWVFAWDGHNVFWNGRITNYGATYPGGLTGSIHTDGQIWSSCLMTIWDEIGAAKTDTIVSEGIRMTGGSTNQAQAAQAVLQAASDIGLTTSELILIEEHFNACGYSVTSVVTDLIFANGFESLPPP